MQLLNLINMKIINCLQVTADTAPQGHDTLGLIALDCMGNVSAGKCVLASLLTILIFRKKH